MIKITTISDTHGREPTLSGGDILIHCGDLTKDGYKVQVIKQLNYLHEQLDKYKYIIMTPGNHDLWAERHPEDFREACKEAGIIMLLNESIELMGLKFWASPATPTYHDWAFNYDEDKIQELWKTIPKDTDVLITHGPPQLVLDRNFLNDPLGCPHLFKAVEEIKPKLHLFGHVHESAGAMENNHTLFINAATCVADLEIEGNKIEYKIK